MGFDFGGEAVSPKLFGEEPREVGRGAGLHAGGDFLGAIVAFFSNAMPPSGSKDPFALRRSALGAIALIERNYLRIDLTRIFFLAAMARQLQSTHTKAFFEEARKLAGYDELKPGEWNSQRARQLQRTRAAYTVAASEAALLDFFADRLKVQQREAGVRHDLIDAVFALGGEDDLVRLLARVRALQAFVETPEGADLLAGYKRAANILKKEGYSAPAQAGAQSDEEKLGSHLRGSTSALSYTPEPAEEALMAALDSAEPRARDAILAEDFAAAMAALASLRAPVDAFFDTVTVNDPDKDKREARLALLARMRAAVHSVADFSRIEG